jgi:predicted Zn-dependent peptidase
MSKKKRQKSFRRKQTQPSQHASLAGLAPVIEANGIFEPLHLQVQIPQKTILYRPTDKLVFVVLGIISGSETVSDINQTLRVDKPLLQAFGYPSCADQSIIQDTLSACTEENVLQLETAIEKLFEQHNLSQEYLCEARKQQQVVTIDLDLSGQPASKNAEGSSKGYFSKKRNIYGRQLARVLVPNTQEIVAEALYPGNKHSCTVFKDYLCK